MNRPPGRYLLTLLPLALLMALPAAATAEIHEVSWNGGHITATANGAFSEATIEDVVIGFDQCSTSPEEISCTWNASIILDSDPERRCNSAPPEEQVVWTSGPQTGNATVEGGPTSFPLEGCPGQSLRLWIEWKKSFEEGSEPPVMRISEGAIGGTILTFGIQPFVEPDRAVPTEYTSSYTPPPFEPNFQAKTFLPSADCRTVLLDSRRYAFAFARMGCHRAANLGRLRYPHWPCPARLRLPEPGRRWRSLLAPARSGQVLRMAPAALPQLDVVAGQVPAPGGDQAVDLGRAPGAGLIPDRRGGALEDRLGDFP